MYKENGTVGYKIVKLLTNAYIRSKVKFDFDDLYSIEGPYLLVCNHATDLDPFLLVKISRKYIRFVGSEHIQRITGGKYLIKSTDMIMHNKGKAGIKTAQMMLRTLKDGVPVAIFPEGNRTFDGVTMDFDITTAKLAAKAGVGVVTYNLIGGYYFQPRWGVGFRRGKMSGRLVHYYSPEEVKELGAEGMYEAMKDDLHEDAWESQKIRRVVFKTGKPMLGFESTFFLCPNCHEVGSIVSTKTSAACKCGFSAKANEFGEIVSAGEVLDLHDLNMKQKAFLENKMSDGGLLFEETLKIQKFNENDETLGEYNGAAKVYSDHIELEDANFLKGEVTGVAIMGRNTVSLYTKDEEELHYVFKGDEHFSGLKYYYYFQLLKNRLER